MQVTVSMVVGVVFVRLMYMSLYICSTRLCVVVQLLQIRRYRTPGRGGQYSKDQNGQVEG